MAISGLFLKEFSAKKPLTTHCNSCYARTIRVAIMVFSQRSFASEGQETYCNVRVGSGLGVRLDADMLKLKSFY